MAINKGNINKSYVLVLVWLANNVGRNVKAHCVLIANVIILRTQWLFWENESLECNPIRYIIVLIAKVTPRPQLLYVSVYRLTYHHEMHQ